ncbi:MAG: hypothetical protein KDK70_28020, partial [Myxococcales bacterium]|nr:hypothetical protein [Myxococcales bacterium]
APAAEPKAEDAAAPTPASGEPGSGEPGSGKPASGEPAASKSAPAGEETAKAAPSAPPPKPPALPRITLATSDQHTCAVVRRLGDEADRVKCWGQNDGGELGLGDRRGRKAADRQMGDALPFVPLAVTSAITAIDASTGRTCALEQKGALWCWGDGPTPPESEDDPPAAPAVVPLPGPVISFGLGHDHACAVLDRGTVHCWGRSLEGAVGLGDALRHEPGPELPAVSLGAGLVAHQVVTGGEYTCVRLDGGRVKCFGLGAYGTLGLDHIRSVGASPGEMGDALPAIDFGAGFMAASLSAGGLHMCALGSDHRVVCWGANRMGQLGLGHSNSPGLKPGQDPTPAPTGDALGRVELGSGGQVVAMDAGNSHTCALIERAPADVGLKCWGAGGQPPPPRGDDPDEMGDALPFIELGAELVPLAISAGGHTCAIVAARSELAGGARPATARLKCWGRDPDGATGIVQDEWDFERLDAMGDALPFVNLGKDVGVVVP